MADLTLVPKIGKAEDKTVEKNLQNYKTFMEQLRADVDALQLVALTSVPAHQLDGSVHTVSGLTPGHFLKALTATTFGFAAHGLTYTDVGALAVGGTAVDSDKVDGSHAAAFALVGHNHAGVYEPAYAAGTTAQYYRGDKTWQTLPLLSNVWPIGSVFIAVVATNPATLLGFGTWSRIAQGRVLVGQDSADTDFDVAEETGGAKTINLAHTHDDHTQVSARQGTSTGKVLTGIGADNHTLHASNLSATQSIMNPYFVVYMWKRTA